MTDTDKKNIYKALVDLTTSYCNTCLDKMQKEKMLLCILKLELIEYAEANELDNLEELWLELARLLNVSVDNIELVSYSKCNCTNGMCGL